MAERGRDGVDALALYVGSGADALPLLLRSFRQAHADIVFADDLSMPWTPHFLLDSLVRQLDAYDVPHTRPAEVVCGQWRMVVDGARFLYLIGTSDWDLARDFPDLLARTTTLWVSGFIPWVGEEGPPSGDEALPETTSRPIPLTRRLDRLYIQDSPWMYKELLPHLVPPPRRIVPVPPSVNFAPDILAPEDNPFGETLVIAQERRAALASSRFGSSVPSCETTLRPFDPTIIEGADGLCMRR